MPGLVVEPAHAILHEQREVRGIARFCENDEKRIARGANFLGIYEAREELSNECVMMPDQVDGRAIAKQLLQPGGADDVGKKHRQESNAMLTAESFNASAALVGVDGRHAQTAWAKSRESVKCGKPSAVRGEFVLPCLGCDPGETKPMLVDRVVVL